MAASEFGPHSLGPVVFPLTDQWIATASSGEGYRCFDKVQENLAWIGTSGLPAWVRIQSKTGVMGPLTSYRVEMPPGLDPAQAPKAWTFEGSNDGNSWAVLDTRTNEISWLGTVIRTYKITVPAVAYVYYRIYITANNGHPAWTTIKELYLWRGETTAEHIAWRVIVTKTVVPSLQPVCIAEIQMYNSQGFIVTNTTDAIGLVSASGQAPGNEGWRAFDGNPTSYWLAGGGPPSPATPQWVKYDFGQFAAPTDIKVVRMTIRRDLIGQAPNEWALQHSDDNGVHWEQFTSFSLDWGGAGLGDTLSFLCASGIGYVNWRISIRANSAGAFSQLASLAMATTPGGPDITAQTSGALPPTGNDHYVIWDSDPSSFSPGHTGAMAFDRRADTFWSTNGNPFGFLGQAFHYSTMLAEVRMQARSDQPEQAHTPSSFLLQASNDGQNWTDIFTPQSIPAWTSPGQIVTFPLLPFYGELACIWRQDGASALSFLAELFTYAPFQIDGMSSLQFFAVTRLVMGTGETTVQLQLEEMPVCELRWAS